VPKSASGRVGHAAEHLRAHIASAQRVHVRRLPSLQVLSEQAGVGYATMWRAVRLLRETGELTTRRGGGIFAPDGGPPRGSAARNEVWGEAWEQTGRAMCGDLLEGRFAPGGLLPTRKQLAVRYGVCYHTLRKALRSLVGQGYLESVGRGFRVPVVSTGSLRSSLVMLSRADAQGADWQTQMSQEFFRALERECSANGIGLSLLTHPFEHTGNAARLRALVRTLQRMPAPPLGVLVRPHGMTDAETAMLARELGSLSSPVAWLDETGLDVPPRVQGRPSNTRVFSLPRNTDLAGRMARHVLGLGHRSAVYVSAAHQADWSRDRLRSLQEAFVGAGGCITAAVAAGADPRPDGIGRALSSALRRALNRTAVAAGRGQGQSMELVMHRLDSQAHSLAQRASLRAQLAPVLRQARSVREATVWVCGNDETALICLDYLQSQGVQVPAQIGVVGFDDTYDALCRGLTTYNFDRAGAIRAVMAYVRGTAWRRQRHTEVSAIPGYVVQRRTLAARR
jgi:DNA-binding LacI/PurR family transcriptional regulator/DNA-binding transcriptional regulator YhcF (GntR family)